MSEKFANPSNEELEIMLTGLPEQAAQACVQIDIKDRRERILFR